MTRADVVEGVSGGVVIHESRWLRKVGTIALQVWPVKACFVDYASGLPYSRLSMDVTRFTKAQVVIIEGVPGAGKTSLQEQLRLAAHGRSASFFPEEALLFGWIHAWLPGIDELRMSLMQRVVDHIEHSLSESPRNLFVLNRFHISYLVFARSPDMQAYDALLARLRKFAVLVLVPQLAPAVVAERALHVERVDPLWRIHLDKRLAQSGFRDLAAMYTAEQDKVRQMLATQQLPYEIMEGSELPHLLCTEVSELPAAIASGTA